jgi:hypothetical protein
VRIIANSAVVDRINKVYQEKIDKWQKILGSGATSHVVAIEKFDCNFIKFESSKIEVLKHIQGDTDENTMLWIPGQRILIAGDVVLNNMQIYTAETDSKARGKWLNSLSKIRELKPSVVIPGHSKIGAPLDANTAVDFMENYLLAFEEELKKANDPDSLINTMKERFPSADFLLAIAKAAGAILVSKDQLFERADILTIHLVLSSRTRGLVGAAELERMKPTARLINASRGPIVEEQALISGLKNKQIAGAAIDVFDIEPLPPSHPFRTLDNVLATPHIGYVSHRLYKTFYEDTVANIRRWLDTH